MVVIELEDAGSAQRLALRKKLKLLPEKTLDLSKKSKVYIDLAVREGFTSHLKSITCDIYLQSYLQKCLRLSLHAKP